MKQTIFIPSGAGAPGFAGICKDLQEHGGYRVIGGDMREGVYGAAVADGFVLMPSSLDAGYVAAVIEGAKDAGASVILPITTAELGVLSERKAEIEEGSGAKLMVSNAAAIGVANHKGRLYEFCAEHGFRVPAFEVVNSRVGFGLACKELGIDHRRLCFKPTEGNGSRGFGIVDNDFDSDWLKEKSGLLALGVAEWQQRLPEKDESWELLLSVFLPGIEFSVDLLCNEGKVLKCFPRSRDKMIGGISVAGTWMKEEGLMQECMALAEALGLHGVIGMQWKMGIDGEFYLLEINPRLQGTTCALTLVGEHLAVDSVRLALGEKIQGDIEGKMFGGWGKSFVRFWDERLL